VKRYKKVFQVGPNAVASDTYWKAREAILQGRIGKATWAQGSYNRNARICLFNDNQRIEPSAGPDKTGEDYINWDMWLGYEWDLAPKIPWTPDHYFRFRKYWPYSGGVATDLLYHKLAPLLIAVSGANGEYPARVNASGGLYIEKDGRDIPDTFLLTADYPSEWSIFLVSTLTNDVDLPDRIFGKYGTMDLGGEVKMRFNGAFQAEFSKRNDDKLQTSVASGPRRDLEGNWIDAMRGKGTVFCNEDLGCSTMVAIKMAVDSYRQRKTMLWDATKEKVYTA
jgi:predicted dehydrogenase